jgi:hypothetical protein
MNSQRSANRSNGRRNGHQKDLGPGEQRYNGLAAVPPHPDKRILAAGGAGYIGSVLVSRLLARGYKVRVLDRMYFGEDSLGAVKDQIEVVVADVRDIPEDAFDGIEGVINLSGLSNDPTAEFSPEANWQMNAIATEDLGRSCVERGIDRYVFASSCRPSRNSDVRMTEARRDRGSDGSVSVVKRRLRSQTVRAAQPTGHRPGVNPEARWSELPTRPRITEAGARRQKVAPARKITNSMRVLGQQ